MTAPWNTDAPIEPYLRRARRAGIDKTVVFAAFHSDYDQANREVARIVARYPGRLIAIEGTDGVGRSTQIQLLREWLEVRGYGVIETGWTRSPPRQPSTRTRR